MFLYFVNFRTVILSFGLLRDFAYRVSRVLADLSSPGVIHGFLIILRFGILTTFSGAYLSSNWVTMFINWL